MEKPVAPPTRSRARRVTLHEPLTIDGQTLSVLTLREPTGEDLRILGAPFTVKQAPGLSHAGVTLIDAEAIAQFISRLAGIPLEIVDELCAADFIAAQFAVQESFQGIDPKELLDRCFELACFFYGFNPFDFTLTQLFAALDQAHRIIKIRDGE